MFAAAPYRIAPYRTVPHRTAKCRRAPRDLASRVEISRDRKEGRNAVRQITVIRTPRRAAVLVSPETKSERNAIAPGEEYEERAVGEGRSTLRNDTTETTID